MTKKASHKKAAHKKTSAKHRGSSPKKKAAHKTHHRAKEHHKKPHHEPEHEKSEEEPTVEEELRTIYEMDTRADEDIDMSKLEIVKQPIVRRVLITLLLILIAVGAGLAGAALLNNPFQNGQSQVLTFDIQPDEEAVVSGRPTTFAIPYQNPSNVPLAELELTLHVPDSFVLTTSTPAPLEEDPYIWEIGTVAPGEHGEVEVSGIFYETPGTAVTLQAITRYAPANFSSPFEDIESESILIEQGILTASINGPDRAIPGESITYTVAIEHAEEEPQTDLELQLALPNGFSITDSSDEPSLENEPIWQLPELTAEEPYTLEITGTFASDISGEQQLVVSAGSVHNDTFTPQVEETFTTDVLASDFALSLIVNGQTGDSIVLPGDNISINLSLDNNGEELAEDLTVELFFDTGLDRVSLGDRNGIPNGDVYGNKINWDYTDMNRLDELRGSEDASIDVAIPTRTEGSTTIRMHAEARIKTVGGIEINRTITSSDVTVRVASDLSGGSSARYYDTSGSAIGSGPMPPRVGQETTYRVTWTVANALNDVEDTVMVAPIPSDAAWGGLVSSSTGTVTHDTVANRVRWAVGDVPAGSSPAIAVFDIKVNPTTADLNTFLDLLGTVTITATDSTTDSTVTSTTPAITTELPSDPFAENQGIVVE